VTDEGNEFRPPDPATPNPFAPRTPPAPTPRGSARPQLSLRYALLVLGVFAIVFGLFIVIRRPAPAPTVTYDDQTRTLFLGSCAIDGSASTRSVCECAYEDIVAAIPYDRFRELDAAALARRGTAPTTGPPTIAGPGTTARASTTTTSPLPDDVRSIFATCVSKQIIATPNSTVPPTTTTIPVPTTTLPPTAAPTPSLTVS